MKTSLSVITALVLFAGISSHAARYRAHDPAWRGVWIWQRTEGAMTAATVDMGLYIVKHPGAWGESLINRMAGNAMAAGVDQFYVRLADQKGHLLYPAADDARVLRFNNWGVDFATYDYPLAWMKLANRTGVSVTFTGSQKDIDDFKVRYPLAKTALLDAEPAGAFGPDAVNSEEAEKKNLVNHALTIVRDFELKAAPTKASLCVTAGGYYELYVNDNQVGMDADWMRGETYDVAPLLKAGSNRITFIVTPEKGMAGTEKAHPGLLFNMNIQVPGGRMEFMDSDLACRIVGKDGQLVKPCITGFEGAGPRFRLKEPFRNNRSVLDEGKFKELTVAVAECDGAALTEEAKALLEGKASLTVDGKKTVVIPLAKPICLYEVRIQGAAAGVACRLVELRDGQESLVAAPFAGREEPPVAVTNELNLPFTPVKVKELRVELAPMPGRKETVKQIQLMKVKED